MIGAASACALLAALLGGCTTGGTPRPAPAPSAELGGRPACPVTRPTPHTALPPSPSIRFINGEYIPGNSNGYGNDDLWVGLPTAGHLLATSRTRHTGYPARLGWWLVRHGDLTLTARSLDGPSRGFAYRVRETVQHGPAGFRSSTLSFPTTGCWRLTGRVSGGEPLSFVVEVLNASATTPTPTGGSGEWRISVKP